MTKTPQSYSEYLAAHATKQREAMELIGAANRLANAETNECTLPHLGAVLAAAYDFHKSARRLKAAREKLDAEIADGGVLTLTEIAYLNAPIDEAPIAEDTGDDDKPGQTVDWN